MKNTMKMLKSTLKVTPLVFCLAFTACDKKKEAKKTNSPITTVLNTSSIIDDPNLTPAQKSVKLVELAERMNNPIGFMYAAEVLEMALVQDSTNKKAAFYKSSMGSLMALKGFLKRIKPLVTHDEPSRKNYDEIIAKYPDSAFRTFVTAGNEDITSEKEMQKFYDDLYKAQDAFRNFLKSNKDSELKLSINDWTIPAPFEKALVDCAVTQPRAGVYELKTCEQIRPNTDINLNRADLEVLQQISAGLQIGLTVMTAYDISGALDFSRKYQDQNSPVGRLAWEELTKNADFGKLRNNGAVLKKIAGLGIDAVAGVRWAVQMKAQLCPQGRKTPDNRPGFLFSKGLCIKDKLSDGRKLEDVLKIVDTVLAGQSIEAKIGDNNELTTQARPLAILENPPQDLKTLAPTFNECGNVTGISDDTLGGVFPNHDGNQALVLKGKCKN